MDKNITSEAKIHYIYETLQKQESRYKWGIFFKWLFRLAILAYIYVFMIYMLPTLLDGFKSSITPSVPGLENINLDKTSIIEQAKQILNNR